MRLILNSLFFLLTSTTAGAGGPIFHEVTRNDLAARSNFIFSGWPSHLPAIGGCAHEFGRWQVHKVLRGDSSFEGKVISIARHRYPVYAPAEAKGIKVPSFAADRYGKGEIDFEQGTSVLFTTHHEDGCFELTAEGAQENRTNEAEIEALVGEPKDCEHVLRGFEVAARRMPADCEKDDDCKLFYVHPNSCGRPYVWNKSADQKMDENFRTLQAKARAACAERWSHQPACSPEVFPVRCRANRCEEGLPVSAPKPKFTLAKMAPSCAPSDGGSMMISVTEEKKDFPIFTLNWWGEGRPNGRGGSFTLLAKNPSMENGFQASYCPYRNGCRSAKMVEIRLEFGKDARDGTLDYTFTTDEGETFHGRVPVKFEKPAQPVFCG